MDKLVIFLLATVIITYLSWPALRNPHLHGFYRFFAFETVILLVLLNLGTWFDDPFTLLHLLSWAALLASIILAIHGIYMLRAMGKPQGKIEDTTQLVTTGAYRYIRHPLYSSLLWVGVGAYLKSPSLVSTSLLIALVAFLIATARAEEQVNLGRFGASYAEYMKKTRMFVPYIF
jgi:protein-S-isoprenylcysteine O-methyltransferase Ste14